MTVRLCEWEEWRLKRRIWKVLERLLIFPVLAETKQRPETGSPCSSRHFTLCPFSLAMSPLVERSVCGVDEKKNKTVLNLKYPAAICDLNKSDNNTLS